MGMGWVINKICLFILRIYIELIMIRSILVTRMYYSAVFSNIFVYVN